MSRRGGHRHDKCRQLSRPRGDRHLRAVTPLGTAVLFVVFNRPEPTARVFEAIRKARPPRLYVAADGPRDGREGEAEKVEAVRRIATNVDWPCEVKTLLRERNFGCRNAVSSAISWFFDNEEQGIILEDDCLPSQSFFWFCENLLDRYRCDTRIWQISGTTFFADKISSPERITSSRGTGRSGDGQAGGAPGTTMTWI